MPIDFESGKWQGDDKETKETLDDLEVKKPELKDYDVYSRRQNKEMAVTISSGTDEAKSEIDNVLKNNERPEAQKLHEEYDKLHVLINSPQTSKAQKNSIAGRMAKIALELDDLGAVLKYGR
tara:strand:- start:1617 stop:1982 length:366 start_codon:yes stop_codon:yes gene_type:complete